MFEIITRYVPLLKKEQKQETTTLHTTIENDLLSHENNNNNTANMNNVNIKIEDNNFTKDENVKSTGYKIVKESAILTSLMTIGSTTAVLFTKASVTGIGFTSAGVIKGSVAAAIQSYFYGGATTGLFSLFQSVGVLGLGFGTLPVAVGGAVGFTSMYLGFKFWQRRNHQCVNEKVVENNSSTQNEENNHHEIIESVRFNDGDEILKCSSNDNNDVII